MSQALQLAEKGLYSTSPNPRVGCVIVHGSQVVGSGWHVCPGQPHAEINALNAAGAAAQGATVYLTLEPSVITDAPRLALKRWSKPKLPR